MEQRCPETHIKGKSLPTSWLCHQPCFPPPSFVSYPEGAMSQSMPASPPPLHPDWKVNSVALKEGRVATKRPTPPKCLTGCRGCMLPFLAPQPPLHRLRSVE